MGPCRIAPLIGFLKKQITLSLGNTKVGTRRIAPLIRILFLGPNEFLVHFNLIGLIRNITAEQLYERANVKNITHHTQHDVGTTTNISTYSMTVAHGRHATSVKFGSRWSGEASRGPRPSCNDVLFLLSS